MPDCLTASVLFRAYLKRLPSGVFRVTVLSTLLPHPVFRSYPLDIGEAAAVERSIRHALKEHYAHNPASPLEGKVTVKSGRDVHAVKMGEKNSSSEQGKHGLALLPAVNVVAAEPLRRAFPCGPEDEHSHADKREEQHAAEGHGEFKQLGGGDEVEHGSPLNYPEEHAKCCCAQNKSTEHAQWVNDVAGTLYGCVHDSPHGLHQPCNQAAVSSTEQDGTDGYAVNGGHLAASPFKEGIAEVGCTQSNEYATPKCRFSVACNAPADEHCGPEHDTAQSPQPTQHLRLRVVWQGLLT